MTGFSISLRRYIEEQKAFSEETFGPGARTEGVLKHIRKELDEIAAKPDDLMEWVDLMILAFDGAWRAGYSPEDICRGLEYKAGVNRKREWPDWRTIPEDEPIEHVRTQHDT